MSNVSKEQMKTIMEKWEREKQSLDEVIGFILRKTYEDERCRSSLDYEDVHYTIKYLKEYFNR